MLTEAQHYSTSDKDDDAAETEGSEKYSHETSIPYRPYSGYSMTTTSAAQRETASRSYKFAQLERAVLSAKILKNTDERTRFENDYLTAIEEDTFDKFANNYYKKIQDHYDRIKKAEEVKRIRRFTFTDFENKFLSNYPTKDIKILFINQSNPPTVSKIANGRSASAHAKSATLAPYEDAAIESFYDDCSRRLLANRNTNDPISSSLRAQKLAESYAHRAAQSLHERFPRMSQSGRHVKIVDQRASNNKPNERQLLEMNHKRTIALITQRRHLVVKMMAQNKKNQTKMERQWKPARIGVDNPACFREILERANENDEVHREKPFERPQTAMIPRRQPIRSVPLCASTDVTPTKTNTTPLASSCLTPLLSSCVTPFRDSLSFNQLENAKDVRIIIPKRPITAPTKMDWVNYC
ncbi:unnamed protein product [Adineta steineri]|uniref:Uncharacterized protein n=1 Tax=Adineta steineri TaxID=433720 RepID=A0A816D1I2_9BILA|nr:unnamed protein product [Adineta steineri]CAF1631253.1 unnamed protein product [Adineta steineri]